MYYEIYIDSLLLVNFVMNLYCLELVNLICLRTATRRRILLGAVLGAVLYLIPFLLPGKGWLKMLILFPTAAVIMIFVTFRLNELQAFARVFSLLLFSSCALGGCMILLLRLLPQSSGLRPGVLGIMGMGGIVFLEAVHLVQKNRGTDLCKVELIGKGARITVSALIDSGNGLIEPVSGKPVCILEKNIFKGLWRNGQPEGFRVIPYHTVGKSSGILYGYLIPELIINKEGRLISCKNIYVGVVDEKLASEGGYRMILNPLLLQEKYRRTG